MTSGRTSRGGRSRDRRGAACARSRPRIGGQHHDAECTTQLCPPGDYAGHAIGPRNGDGDRRRRDAANMRGNRDVVGGPRRHQGDRRASCVPFDARADYQGTVRLRGASGHRSRVSVGGFGLVTRVVGGCRGGYRAVDWAGTDVRAHSPRRHRGLRRVTRLRDGQDGVRDLERSRPAVDRRWVELAPGRQRARPTRPNETRDRPLRQVDHVRGASR